MSKSEADWKKCINCSVTINKKNIKSHQKCCPRQAEFKSFLLLPHGFIWDGVFYAKLTKIEDVKVPFSTKPVVLMHPSIMKMFKYGKGSYVLLNSKCDQQVYRAWPCATIEPSCIAFPTSVTLKNDSSHISLHHYNERTDVAEHIFLASEIIEDFMFSQKFKQHFLQEFNDDFIRIGMSLHRHYRGKFYEFHVNGVKGMMSQRFISYTHDKGNSAKIACSANCSQSLGEQQGDSVHVDVQNDSIACCSSDTSFDALNSSVCSLSNTSLCNDVSFGDQFESFCMEEKPDTDVSTCNYFFMVASITAVSICSQKKLRHLCNDFFTDICGLEQQVNKAKKLFFPFFCPEYLYGQSMPKGVLFVGPSGNGKSFMAKAISTECYVPFLSARASDFQIKNNSSSLSNMKSFFRKVAGSAPCILFIDNIDNFFSDRDSSSPLKESYENTLFQLINDLPTCKGKNVLTLATTNKPECIDSNLRKKYKLEEEILFGMPSENEIKQILIKLIENRSYSLSGEYISELTKSASGLTRGDLKNACDKALFSKNLMYNEVKSSSLSPDQQFLLFSDINQYLKKIKSSVKKEFEVPNVLWSDIGGMHKVKEEIKERIIWPLQYPDHFKQLGISPPCGILMFGPPGCSKTMLAKALATECNLNFFSVKGPELYSKYVGESEKAVSNLFCKARSAAPSIIFFDEFDSLVGVRGSFQSSSNVSSRLLSQILVEIDGIGVLEGVCILAATNRPDLIDPAFLRPGRFDRVLYIPLPDSDTRREIFLVKLKKIPVGDIDIDELVDLTENYSGAEIVAVCETAARLVIAEDLSSTTSVVNMSHLKKALCEIKPRTSSEYFDIIKGYEAFYSSYKYQC